MTSQQHTHEEASASTPKDRHKTPQNRSPRHRLTDVGDIDRSESGTPI
ncbi:MAG: hypothetical protein K2O61_02705 [Bacteroidaceae bacterium]|nr:hypothetical protein [Bacteroidaceae bacterium]